MPDAALRRALAAVDVVLALLCACLAVLRLVASPRPATSPGGRGLLVLDAAYELDEVRQRNLVHSITSRDLGGFFEHVWSVHPLVGAAAGSAAVPQREVRREELAPGHTFLEGGVRRYRGLSRLPMTDFVLAQSSLLRALSELLARERISVVRVGDPYYQGLLGLLLARWARIPLVIRINGNYDAIYASVGRLAYPRLFRRRRVEKLVDRFVLPRAALVAGANSNNLQYALDNGARPGRTAVFRYGNLIDPVHWSDPAARPPVVAELGVAGRYVVCVSRLEAVKHPEDVVEVLRQVTSTHPDVSAVLVGDGAERETLTRLAVRYGVGDHVLLVGNRDQQWIASALAHCAVVLSPMTGRALVEAALSARPIVAYDVEWHSELLTDGRTGFLVPYRDTAAMAGRTVELLDADDDAREVGRAARAATAALMDPERLQQEEQQAYLRALSGAPG